MPLNPDVALALKYGADHEWRTTRGWRKIYDGDGAQGWVRYFCVHGCDQMKFPTATWVKAFPPVGYQLRIDAACDEHAARAGVPESLLSLAPMAGAEPVQR